MNKKELRESLSEIRDTADKLLDLIRDFEEEIEDMECD